MTFLLVFQLSNHSKTEKARIADDAFWMTYRWLNRSEARSSVSHRTIGGKENQ